MLTDPVELARWFAPYVEGSGKVGETLLLGWSPERPLEDHARRK